MPDQFAKTQLRGSEKISQESSAPLSRTDPFQTLTSRSPRHGLRHISERREQAMDIKTPDMCEIGTARKSKHNGVATAHFVLPRSSGNGTDHDVTWCGGGYAYIETPHPRAKFCPKCRRLGKEYFEE